MNQALATATRDFIAAALVSPTAGDEQAITFEADLIEQGVMSKNDIIEEIYEVEQGDDRVTVVLNGGEVIITISSIDGSTIITE